MILRRVIEHVRNQQWTAIWIDLIIVVVGVFIGIQVANWNEARSDRAAYQAALGRLAAEIDTNLAMLDSFDVSMKGEIAIASRALTVLQTCVESAENRRIVNEGLEMIRSTSGLHPRRNALDAITTEPRLLAQQSPAERHRFSEMLYYFDVLQKTADRAEHRPEDNRAEGNPLLRVGAAYPSSFKYHGFDWVSTRRKLELAVPVSVACEDNMLVKSFFNWERIQGSLPIISRKWRAELVETKKLIEARP